MNCLVNTACLLVGLMLLPAGEPSPGQENLRKGKEALERYKTEDAIRHLNESIRLDPNNPETYYTRGLAYEQYVKHSEAIADFRQAIRLDPKFGPAYAARGYTYYLERDLVKAIADLSEAIRLDPKDFKALNHRGWAYYDSKDYANAISDHKEAIRIKPKDAIGYNNLAAILAQCPQDEFRDGKKALQYATEACKLTSWKMYPCLATLATAHAELGDFDEAIKWQKKAIDMIRSVNPEIKKMYEKRLKMYEEHKPARFRSRLDG